MDQTASLSKFEDDIDSGDLSRLIAALDNIDIMNANVLCPFGCTEFCFKAKEIDWDVILQRYLLDSVLPHFSKSKPNNLYSMSNHYFRDEDNYDCILLNPKWKIPPTIIFTTDGLRVLTCRHHGSRDDHLRLYPPRPPRHNLSADQTDQLSHCVINPRIARPTKQNKFTTTHSMARQFGGFSGLDTMNVTTTGDWSKPSVLMAEHESNILHGRNDLIHWLSLQIQAK